LDEMTRYLTAVFKVMYAAEPGTEAKMGCDAETLAMVTSEEAFSEADLNHDGKLSFVEFKQWYSTDGTAAGIKDAEDTATGSLSLDDIRRITRLAEYSSSELFEVFAAATDSQGYISREAFVDCFAALVEGAGGPLSIDDEDLLQIMYGHLYELFDTDDNGVVDFTEVTTGLTVVCGGSMDEKAKAAFDLYDYNHDGVISLDEMTRYLTSVFKVMYKVDSSLEESMGKSADDLAEETAIDCFESADLDHDGKLTFKEFKQWYSSEDSQDFRDASEWQAA